MNENELDQLLNSPLQGEPPAPPAADTAWARLRAGLEAERPVPRGPASREPASLMPWQLAFAGAAVVLVVTFTVVLLDQTKSVVEPPVLLTTTGGNVDLVAISQAAETRVRSSGRPLPPHLAETLAALDSAIAASDQETGAGAAQQVVFYGQWKLRVLGDLERSNGEGGAL